MADRSGDLSPWWRGGTIYQVYPRSFQDANGDGVGDLAGIRERLPYLRALGVDGVWLSPFYPSPMADFGYDVSDHQGVDPLFGTLEDFDALAAEARRLGLRLILDYVPNHTSSEHPWFREHPEYYIWREEPNNWVSVFGGSAWEPRDGRFYYHAYLREQPDLDWRRDDVRERMLGVLRFWCEHGADGFRIDALRQTIKDAQWRDNPVNPDWDGRDEYDSLIPAFTTDQPEVQELVRQFRETVGERLLIGELYLPIERLVAYYGSGLDMPANFHLLSTAWGAAEIAALVERYEAALPDGAWPNWVLSNHDRPRVASRTGQPAAAAMLLLTLRGTPTLYYGDEIGMTDVEIEPGREQDPWGGRRDPARTPMQWDAGGGFSAAEPWLPYGDLRVNVAAQQDDPASLLSLHRRLLRARRDFALEGYETLAADGVLAYRRGGFVIALNLGADAAATQLTGEIAVATDVARAGEHVRRETVLGPGEGIALRVP
ncbi:alpha-amylase family glycosyl hydrolase [Candidatus Solirubrobacter pratensis]|uniref:alpha-amylase family glycosyl hydrolase n=1 Tax=Candidatus Solirubrobacter pratensis TaxID=1298857 RepID=UPI0004169339|nr:alpha-amylase family glycosyl hydrolase [Candidatus Solirubrobacter pratensis]